MDEKSIKFFIVSIISICLSIALIFNPKKSNYEGKLSIEIQTNVYIVGHFLYSINGIKIKDKNLKSEQEFETNYVPIKIK